MIAARKDLAQAPSNLGSYHWSIGTSAPYALVASGLLTPIIVSLLCTIVRPVFFHRFLIICLPAWLLAWRWVCARANGAHAVSAIAGSVCCRW